jgi:hypothetical protein
MSKPTLLFRGPVKTRSGYGAHSRDLLESLYLMDIFDIKIDSCLWGNTPLTALDDKNTFHQWIEKNIVTSYNVSLQTIWREINCTITGIIKSFLPYIYIYVYNGEKIGNKLPRPYYNNSLFLGWFTNNNILITREYIVTNSITIYARWAQSRNLLYFIEKEKFYIEHLDEINNNLFL